MRCGLPGCRNWSCSVFNRLCFSLNISTYNNCSKKLSIEAVESKMKFIFIGNCTRNSPLGLPWPIPVTAPTTDLIPPAMEATGSINSRPRYASSVGGRLNTQVNLLYRNICKLQTRGLKLSRWAWNGWAHFLLLSMCSDPWDRLGWCSGGGRIKFRRGSPLLPPPSFSFLILFRQICRSVRIWKARNSRIFEKLNSTWLFLMDRRGV